MELTQKEDFLAKKAPWLVLACMLLVLFQNSFFFFGYWIDESVTYWVIKDSFSEVTQRAYQFQGQSPLYFWFLWAWGNAFGFAEPVLRFPSLLFLLGSLALTAAIARESFGENSGIPAVMTVLGFTRVQWLLSARPYAFGFFCCLLSVYALLRLQKGASRCWLLCFVLSSAGILFAHSLFGAFFAVHAILWFADGQRPRRLSLSTLVICWGLAILSFVPGLLQLQHLASERHVLQFDSLPPFIEILKAYFPRGITIACLATMVFVRYVLPESAFDFAGLDRRRVNAYLTWYVFPPLLLFAFCVLSGTVVFKSRYYVWQAPALALVYGAFVASIRPATARLAALMLLVAAVLMQQYSSGFADESWNSAVALANKVAAEKHVPVFVQPGLVESRDISWIQDSVKRDYLLSPLAYYRLDANPAIIPLMIESDEAKSYSAKVIEDAVAKDGQFLFLAYRPDSSIAHFFEAQGYEVSEVLQDARDVELRLFRRVR